MSKNLFERVVSKMAEGETAGVHFVNLHFDGGHPSNDSMEELKLLGLHVYTDPLTEGSSDVGYIVSKTPIAIEQVMKKYSPMLVDLTDEEKAEWLETHHLMEL